MSKDIGATIDQALLRRHYDNDEYVSLIAGGMVVLNGIPFTLTQDYHVVGSVAYMNDPTVPDFNKGWTLFAHGQPAAPAYLAPILAAVGVTWPAQVPAFEAKDTLFWSDQDCWVWFEGVNRSRHFIPANTYKRYHRRFFMLWVVGDTVPGTLRVDIEG